MRGKHAPRLAEPRGQPGRSHLAADLLLRPDRLPDLEDDSDDAAHEAERGRHELEEFGHVRRRRGRRGREGGAPGGRRLPARSEALRKAGRASAERPAPLRPARHREDAARQGRRARVRRQLLLAERIRVRRDVRRPRRLPNPQALCDSAQERAVDHLHRRARRRRRRSHGQRLQPRAGPDVEPAARRARRLRERGPGRRHGRVQPHSGSGYRPAPSRPLRPAAARRAARPRRSREDPRSAHPRQAARRGHRPARRRPPDRRARRGRPREHLQRGGDLRRPTRPRQHRADRVRGGDGAGRRRSPAAARRQREGEAHPRLPRGRPRADVLL